MSVKIREDQLSHLQPTPDELISKHLWIWLDENSTMKTWLVDFQAPRNLIELTVSS